VTIRKDNVLTGEITNIFPDENCPGKQVVVARLWQNDGATWWTIPDCEGFREGDEVEMRFSYIGGAKS
jgi:hypothetical protein